MSYVVFARKWRPQNFDEVICQEHITTTLKNAITNNRVAHAYIFTGPRGIGKTSVARIFAKGLNCEKGHTTSPCDRCPSCRSIVSGTSMDVIEIDGASNNSVDQVRELRENIKFSPAYGRYKVYIIDEVHMLSIGAFNALLKTLEEPPKHAKFVFATTNPEKVPATVLSRCQRFDFRKIPLRLIISKLKKIVKEEKLDVSEDALFSIAKAADGSMRDAESILDQLTSFCEQKIDHEDVVALLGVIEEERLAAIVDKLSQKDAAALLKEIDELIISGKDMSQFLSGLMGYLRNLMVIKVSNGLSSLIDLPDNHVVSLKEQMKNFQIEELLYIFYILQATANAIRRSEVARFIIEVSFIKLSLRDKMMSLPEIMDKITHLEADIERLNPSRNESEKRIALSYRDPGRGESGDSRILTTEKESASKDFSSALPDDLPARGESKTKERSSSGFETKKSDEEEIVSREENVDVQPAKAGDRPEEATPLLAKEIAKKIWPQIIQAIKSKKMSIASYLIEGELINISASGGLPSNSGKGSTASRSSIITIGFLKKYNFHKEVLEHVENRKFVENIASEVLGRKIQLEFVTVEKPEMSAGDADISSQLQTACGESEYESEKDVFEEPIIQSALELFDGRIVGGGGDFRRPAENRPEDANSQQSHGKGGANSRPIHRAVRRDFSKGRPVRRSLGEDRSLGGGGSPGGNGEIGKGGSLDEDKD